MFDIGFLELLVIGVLALLVLGPERLPGAIKSCVSTVRSIKEMANGFKQEVSSQLDAHELHQNLKKAEALGMRNISPELKASVDELKAAADSVQRPYKKTPPAASEQDLSLDEPNTIGRSMSDDTHTSIESLPEATLPQTSEKRTTNE